MTSSSNDENEVEFAQAMAPTVEVLRDLTEEVRDVSGRHGHLPDADSPAMRDQNSQENELQKVPSWDVPMSDAQTMGAMTLNAACDSARCFADLFAGTQAPVFGHLVLARSALEACVVSRWLNDPTILAEERQRRALRELIYSAEQSKQLKIEDESTVDARIAQWTQVATDLGWAVTRDRGRPVVGGVNRPSVPSGIDDLMLDNSAFAVGRAMWGYLSGVEHVTWFALRQAFVTEPDTQNAAIGPNLATIGTESRSVYIQSFLVLRALDTAAETRVAYMGWEDAEWRQTRRSCRNHELELLHRIIASLDSSNG